MSNITALAACDAGDALKMEIYGHRHDIHANICANNFLSEALCFCAAKAFN